MWGGGVRSDCYTRHALMRLAALPLVSEDLRIL